MSTLDDLRSTLAVHAPVEDADLLDRAGAVRSRVRVVRRRRRLSAAVAAVAAVVAVAAGVAVPRLVGDRGEPDLAASTTVTVGGFEYRLLRVAETEPGQETLDVSVPRQGPDLAVALLADGLGKGRATLRPASEDPDVGASEGTAVDRIVRNGANPAVPLYVADVGDDPDAGHYRLRVEAGTARTRVGVAVYERTGRMPAGVVDPTGRTVFREQVGSRRLLDASFAEPGQAETTFAFTGRIDRAALEGFCSTGRRGDVDGPPWVNLSVDGGAPLSWGGCRETSEDAGSGSTSLDDAADGRHTVRVWSSETVGGEPRAYAGMVLGGAVYDDSQALVVDGIRVDPVIEFDGRRWQLDRDRMSRSLVGAHRLEVEVSAREPVLLGYTAEGVRRLSVRVDGLTSSAGGNGTAVNSNRGAMSSVSTVLLPAGGKYTLSWPAKDHGSATVLEYHLLG